MAIYLNDLGIVCALGDNKAKVLKHFLSGNTAFMRPDSSYGVDTVIGKVSADLPDMAEFLDHQKTRNNQIALLAFKQIADSLAVTKEALKVSGKNHIKIAVIIGTSTSGIASGEQSMKTFLDTQKHDQNYHYRMQEMGAPAEFIAQLAEANASVYAISTACTSSAKALISGQRLLTSGLADIVITGGVDSLCKMTINGFSSLESISSTHTQPFQQQRNGINIGEGAALFVMSKVAGPVILQGYGESSDAHHISAPHPQGEGAKQAMRAALNKANLSSDEIDYINLHGTGTKQNDAMEALAVNEVFSEQTFCTPSKQLHGHCLGAAGAIEAGLCWLLLTNENHDNIYPKVILDGDIDTDIAKLNLTGLPSSNTIKSTGKDKNPINNCMSNSYAFGGNNASLVLAKNVGP